MKALTICQPYAELILRGEKLVENREWHTPHRGTILLHAGKSKDWLSLSRDRTRDESYGIALAQMTFGAALERASVETKAEPNVFTPTLQYPFAWARVVSTQGDPTEPPEDDYELVAQDCQPSGENWFALYRKPYSYRMSSRDDLRRLLLRARNFITSNYFEGDLPAFDKPDALLQEIHEVLDGTDAPDSSEKTASNQDGHRSEEPSSQDGFGTTAREPSSAQSSHAAAGEPQGK
jgi:hypothetical protein